MFSRWFFGCFLNGFGVIFHVFWLFVAVCCRFFLMFFDSGSCFWLSFFGRQLFGRIFGVFPSFLSFLV